MSAMSEAAHSLLRWVLHEDRVVHVSDFHHLHSRDRPEVHCPVCLRPVILHLGNIKVHHYQHHPGEDCAATAPESAAHLAVKFYVAQTLEGVSKLLVNDTCVAPHANRFRYDAADCTGERLLTFASGWDNVHVERGLKAIRPDILLTKGEKPVAAVEVFATHAVDEDKAEYLKELGVPWIEIAADPEIFSTGRWVPEDPVPYLRRHPQEEWVCGAHEEALRKQREYESTGAECRTQFVRIFDLYHPSGGWYRRTYWIRGWFPEGSALAKKVWISGLDGDENFLVVDEAPAGRDTLRALHNHLRKYLAGMERKGAIVDSPMAWAKPDQFVRGGDELFDYDVYPGRYRWVRKRRNWWLPPDLKNITWPLRGQFPPGKPPSKWIRKGLQLSRHEHDYPRWGRLYSGDRPRPITIRTASLPNR